MNRYCFLLILALTGNLFAQPQAPITWQATRSLRATVYPYVIGQVYPHGDTLFVGGSYQSGSGSHNIGAISSNLGQTWSAWHYFPNTLHSSYSQTGTVFLSNGIFNCDEIASGSRGFYRTTDLGTTWLPPTFTGYINPWSQVGDTVYCLNWNDSSAFYTSDCLVRSDLWRPPLPFREFKLGYSQGILHVVERTVSDRPGFPSGHIYYARGHSWGGSWEPTRDLDSFATNLSQEVRIDFDESGNGCLLMQTNSSLFGNDFVFLRTTQNNGLTWTPAQQVSPGATASIFDGYITHYQYLWIGAWNDATVSPGFTGVGTWVVFSANRGRSWYPSQQGSGLPNDNQISHFGLCAVEIRGNRIRIYDNRNGVVGDDSVRVCLTEGTILADTIAPLLTQPLIFSNSVSPDSTITVSIHGHDNDSLWMMGVVLHNASTGDSSYLPLARVTGETYSGQWHSPTQTGEWTYYYRAEDMWENVTTYPTDAIQNPLVVWVGPVSAKEQAALPQEPYLKAFPNPVNGMITFTGRITATHYPIKLSIYNLTGALVATVDIRPTVSCDYRTVWDCRNTNGKPVASGVYFAQLKGQTRMSVLPDNKLVRFSIVR